MNKRQGVSNLSWSHSSVGDAIRIQLDPEACDLSAL